VRPIRPLAGVALGLPGSRLLSLEGELPPRPRLAVVGARACHRRPAVAAGEIVRAAGRAGWSLVSGGALGIDGHAHRAALAGGVPQVAVLPCGPDAPYPPAHAGLFADIAAARGSAVLWAQPAGRSPSRGMFASRNAIVLALSDAVVVVEAALRSGSLGTGRAALARRLAVAVVPGSPGCIRLAALGAHVLDPPDAPTTDAWLAAVRGHETPPPGRAVAWPEHLRWLESALVARGSRGASVDDLGGETAAVVALAQAEALGLVEDLGAGRWLAR
jgi:DNA processing protein